MHIGGIFLLGVKNQSLQIVQGVSLSLVSQKQGTEFIWVLYRKLPADASKDKRKRLRKTEAVETVGTLCSSFCFRVLFRRVVSFV